MLAVIRWTLWQRRWSRLWWIIGIVALVLMTMAFYPSIHNQAEQLNNSFSNLNADTLALFGGTDFFSPVGYLNSQLIYFTLPLVLAVFAISMGSGLLGREESTGSLEVLLARPLSRGKLLTAKATAGVIDIFIVTAIGSAAIILMAWLTHMGIPLLNILIACLACFLLVITFGAVAFLLAATGRGRIAALGIAATYGLAGYLLGSLSSTIHWLDKPSLVFPYHYYHTADILRGTINWWPFVFFAVFSLACVIIAYISFRRRDIQ